MPVKDHTYDAYDTPPDNPSPFKMVWKELDKKAVKEVMEAKIATLEDSIERVEQEARKPHLCGQDARLKHIEDSGTKIEKVVEIAQKSISDMYKWYARGLGALIFVLLTSGVAFVWYLSGLSYNLENNNVRLEKVEKKQDDVRIAPALDPAAFEPMLQKLATTAAQEAVKANKTP
jgi:hypothetical protein